jgi:hypothetical protein
MLPARLKFMSAMGNTSCPVFHQRGYWALWETYDEQMEAAMSGRVSTITITEEEYRRLAEADMKQRFARGRPIPGHYQQHLALKQQIAISAANCPDQDLQIT